MPPRSCSRTAGRSAATATAPTQFINLAGKLSYDSATNTLVINLGGSGLTLPTDAYRIILHGSGSQVLANPQGIALDGENLTNNDDPNRASSSPCPPATAIPGGNFYDTFIINTTPAVVTPGTFQLDPTSDTNIVGDFITFSNLPSFVGSITEPNPLLVPAGRPDRDRRYRHRGARRERRRQTFFDPSFGPAILLALHPARTPVPAHRRQRQLRVTVGVDAANTGLVTNTTPPADSPYNVGSSGQLTPLPGTVNGFYVARARVIDQSGNQSNPADPNATANFVVDTLNARRSR